MSYYIYKICCDDCPDFVYVGSTKAFRERKWRHKQRSKTENCKLYTTIRENGGWDKWRMVMLEDIGEVSLTEARIKEEEHRVKLNANLNINKCFRTEEQKKQDVRDNLKKSYEKNKNYFKDYYKNYYDNNKEKIKKQQKERYTCECGRTFRIAGKAEHERSLIHKKFINEKENI